MIKNFLFIILSLFSCSTFAQPLVSYYLGSRSEISRGRPFKSIEELSEIIVKGMTPIPFRTLKEFNPQGNIVSSILYNSAGGKTAETYWEYLNGQKLTKKNHRYFANIAGWREEGVKVEYDQNQRIPERIELLKEGKVIQWSIVTADTLGRIESVKVFGSSGAHLTTERLLYIETSNMIRVMVYRANGQFHGTWTYPMDTNKEFIFESVTRQYYPNGNIMIETLTNSVQGDQAYYYEYQYDNEGNWVTKETYQVKLGRNNSIKNKKIEHRITRNISYY